MDGLIHIVGIAHVAAYAVIGTLGLLIAVVNASVRRAGLLKEMLVAYREVLKRRREADDRGRG